MNKSQLGQFFTTKYEYILSNMEIPPDIKTIVEPFVGNGDLLKFIPGDKYNIEIYDIDPKIENTTQQDTLTNPPNYTGKFVLTNPPYLARNKSTNKDVYAKYRCNDLYKCFILSIIADVCDGGIIIIPLNFLSSIRKADVELRKKFLNKYSITLINIFEERVFVDTGYAVCSIQFVKKTNDVDGIKTFIYPSKKEMNIYLNAESNYTIGGEIYNLKQNQDYKIHRATKNTNNTSMTNILLKCIDDSKDSLLGFKIVKDDERFIDTTEKLSARSYATLIITPNITPPEQQRLTDLMNQYLTEQREKYNSLFLTNYRESNTIARKRISFDLAFKICNWALSQTSR